MGLFREITARDSKPLELALGAPRAKVESVSTRTALDEDEFLSMLYLERRRSERANKRYVLMLIDVREALEGLDTASVSARLMAALCQITRETDIIGWYLGGSLIGVIGTEIGQATPNEIRRAISEKFREAFAAKIGADRASLAFMSFHFFPEEDGNGTSGDRSITTLYPDLSRKEASQRLSLGAKRLIDIFGSACALLLLSPIFALVAIAIKLTSRGPALFRQERLGQYGKGFKLLKFRSMRTNCDSKIHEEYVSQFIAGQVSAKSNKNGDKQVFKLQKDPRITPVGGFIRKTSLDELPQFWNVLIGDMSLVGPRPPVLYEFKAYEVWHRRRVLEIKPGITGLWQVEGRSRTEFDDMVRLDLRYARQWNLWLDLKILLRTPAAVISGDGAH